MSVAVRPHPSTARRAWLLLAALLLGSVALLPLRLVRAVGPTDHLVISEIVTGGASASDELIELYNPTPAALPLEGLELIYVSSTGATISRRAAWGLGAPTVASGGHVLVANEAGLFAGIADASYGTGMAASGGSVALRILGATSAIDAVGWGTAASTWREGTNAVPPAAGASIERLPGGALGSGQDTDDNSADFVERPVPEPQNLASSPTPAPGEPTPAPGEPTPTPAPTAPPSPSVEPTLTASPSPTASATPSAEPSAEQTATPSPGLESVAAARAAPDGTTVTIEATALTGSEFHDGGGYVADATGGIAVLLPDGAFARGSLLRISGDVDDRFSQRTLRSTAADVEVLGPGVEPPPSQVTTGSVDELDEGRLVRAAGAIVGSPTTLTSGAAFDLDDGSGAVRIVVGTSTGIDVSGWANGVHLELVGVVGQRDSTGSGTEGYRLQPRDPGDVLEVVPPSTPTPEPSTPGSSSSAAPSPSDAPGVVTIAEARAAAKNARLRVRGVVTLAPGTVDPQTAVIQDASGAIVLRLGDEVGPLSLGEGVEVDGTRSTKGGMETLRVTVPPRPLGTASEPKPRAIRTGDGGEAVEALLVVARGALVASASQASSGTVSFEIDDGSGPLRVSLGASLDADDSELERGTWVEVVGVLGQETTGAQPLRGYRIWPRSAAEVRVVAAATATTAGADAADDESGDGPTPAGLSDLGSADLAGMTIAATVVVGPWPEVGLGGVLWDGSRLVAVEAASAEIVTGVMGASSVPMPVELAGVRAAGTDPGTGAALVALAEEPAAVVRGRHAPAAPRPTTSGALPAWVSLVGRLGNGGDAISASGTTIPLDRRCDGDRAPRRGDVGILAVATGDPVRLIVPCGGIVPASALGSSSASAIVSAAPDAQQTAAERPIPRDRRPLVAGLLGAATLTLLGAAGWAWSLRGGPDDGAAAPDDHAAGLPGDGDEADGLEESPPGRARLTLVRVPGERGP